MNVISLQEVEKSYGTRLLFKDASMTITTEQRIGLIGVNGTGKSTFLKLLAGVMEPDKGSIEINGKASVYYLPQAPQFDEEASLLENIFLANHPLLKLVREFERQSKIDATSPAYVKLLNRMDAEDGWSVEQQARTILTKLGLGDVERPVRLLSGGERRRLALGQALLYPCDILLLDEPTNHLDEASIDWLEKYLLARSGGFVLSTHDRYFLDAVCNSILELDNRRFYRYEGSYETFLELKADREAREAAGEAKRAKLLKHELAWVRRGAQARSTKQKARLQRYEALAAMEKSRRVDTLDPIALSSRLGKTIFDMEHLTFAFDDRPIVTDFTYHVVKHDRIGIVGPNGIGKSTFMKLLDGTYTPQEGTVGRGETVKIAHFTQELPPFDENQRVLDYIREDHRYMVLNDGSTLSAGQVLERFLFTPELHGVPLRKLSGGERRRLYLLKLLMSAPNVLLLDEPTNDLDIPTLSVLEEFLDSFGGVVITVCHDRYFLDRVVDKLFVFEGNGAVRIFHGSYSDYKEQVPEIQDTLAKRNRLTQTKGEKQATPGSRAFENKTIAGNSSSSEEGAMQVEAQDKGQEKSGSKKPLNLAEQKELEELEGKIAEGEGLVKAYEAMLVQLADDYEAYERTMAEKADAEEKLESAMERWMELSERV